MIRKVLILLLALAALSLGVSSLLGIRPFIQKSDSMEPDYHNGDLIFADTSVSYDSLTAGDVIIYQGFTQELTRYQGSSRVKSDNASATVEITPSQLIGRAVFSIPWVGNAVEFFLQHQYLAWIIVVVLFVGALLPNPLLHRLVHTEEKPEQEQKEQTEKPRKGA